MSAPLIGVLVFLHVTVQLVSCSVHLGFFQMEQHQRKQQDERNRRELNDAIKRQLDAYFAGVQPIDEDLNIPMDKVRGLEAVFKLNDKNRDGKLTLEELKRLVDPNKSLSVKQLEDLMNAADTDRDGSLTIKELAQHIAKGLPAGNINWDFNRDKARLLDLNKDGYIDMEEFQRMYRFCNQNFQRQLVQRVIQVGDQNKDKQLSYKEMASVMSAKPDVLTGGGGEQPSEELLERVKYCMATFIEKCKKGWCNRPLTEFKQGKISIMEVLKMPFMSSSSVLTPIFNYSG